MRAHFSYPKRVGSTGAGPSDEMLAIKLRPTICRGTSGGMLGRWVIMLSVQHMHIVNKQLII